MIGMTSATPARIQVTRSNKTNNPPQKLQTSEDCPCLKMNDKKITPEPTKTDPN